MKLLKRNPRWEKQQNMLYVISLLDEIMNNCTTTKLFKWCNEQKTYWKGEYAKIK
jgi:hypothetical protein